MKILVTGGSGFIGSNLVRLLVQQKGVEVVNLDKLTYAGNAESLADLVDHPNYTFEQVDLCDAAALQKVCEEHQPDAVMHLAAESHVDRSIDGPGEFIQTNIVGTYNLLQASLQYWKSLPTDDSGSGIQDTSNPASRIPHHVSQKSFRFLHVSTDEVYGSLAPDAAGFAETTPYDPHSPYSASKAASDHLARAWCDTYGLPVLVTNCSNNYGPYQFPEKLIPVVILKCLRGEPIPVYGKGENIRDWLYVEDHAEALYTVLTKGRIGETYNIGGNNEQKNIDLVRMICALMEGFRGQGTEDRVQRPYDKQSADIPVRQPEPGPEPSPDSKFPMDDAKPEKSHQQSAIENQKSHKTYEDLITFVTDRPGHDMRYAIDASKIRDELGWEPKEDFESGFRKTVQWYLENRGWWERILSGDYKLERLGSGGR